MYGVCRLHHLQQLHLAYNGILTIEGMKELTQLRHLNLEGNNIKAIEHLTTNCKLEYLNLAENSIVAISDLSYLKCLKVRIANIYTLHLKYIYHLFIRIVYFLYHNSLFWFGFLVYLSSFIVHFRLRRGSLDLKSTQQCYRICTVQLLFVMLIIQTIRRS